MKDERLRKMNQEYHEIPIPAELRNRVEAGIREAKKDMATENQTTTATTEKKRKPVKKKNKMIAFVKTAGGAVAARCHRHHSHGQFRRQYRPRHGENPGDRSYRGGCYLPGIPGQHQSDVC